ncbi:MAG: GTPase HflX [Lachnospiraceae bacterium]|nr:GTPase HflX [Lachnospiraceae bacterium]
MIENEVKKERFVLLAAVTDDGSHVAESLRELAELLLTAGAEPAGQVVQMRENIHPGTYLGKGKLEEVRETAAAFDADGVVCDDELTPAQYNNLADILEMKVMDRTMLILDIFAGRARSREGKIQVELAQLRYRSARLLGIGRSMSRLGGGIGTRGPGEKKLEMDRRLIGKRISALKEELAEVKRHRELIRGRRQEGKTKTCALVGYTNAGKSTLLNRLTGADVLAEDALFATLDPTTRELILPDGDSVLLTDTVGFIRKLPHHLVEAFKSTLEEAALADLILHVVDAGSPYMDMQMEAVYEALRDLGAGEKPVYTLFNKMDRIVFPENRLLDPNARKCFFISAKEGNGLEELLKGLSEFAAEGQILIEREIPYSKAGFLARIRTEGKLFDEEYLPRGIRIRARVPRSLYGQMNREL